MGGREAGPALRPRHLRAWLLRAALLLFALLPLPALAQGLPSLVADSLTVEGQTLIVEGNVEVLYDGTRLSAARLTYDQRTDQLAITGPIFIETPEGDIFTATRAELSSSLERGLLLGARLVLDRRLQLAAAAIRREGELTELTRAVATSCQVCAGRAPLWEIRAARVTHDEVAHQLWFEEATFHVRGLPILYIPRLRLPDPSVDRATGLLIPDIKSSDRLGFGLKFPYFITLGQSRDLTLTPYLSALTRTLEARYRQAFFAGDLTILGAVSDDELAPGDPRGFVFADAGFDLGGGYALQMDLRLASDRAYLATYGYSDEDLLTSAIRLTGVTEGSLTEADLSYYTTLRDGESQDDLPPLALRWERQRRLALGPAARLDFGTSIDAFARPGDGRDLSRVGAWAGLGTSRILPGGLVAEVEGRVTADLYQIADDPRAGPLARLEPAAIATLRWPFVRPGAVTQTLEPIAALAWSEAVGGGPPNEDSPLAELDEGNLFALSRFPGEDAREEGLRAAAGLAWTGRTPEGAQLRLTFGRLFRAEADARFSDSSGLSGTASDLLLASQLEFPGGLTFTARTLYDPEDGVGKTGAEVNWTSPRIDLGAAYVWLPEDDDEGRDDPVAEWSVEADYRINERWRLGLDGRYDVASDQAARAGIGIGWRNECVSVDFSLSRRYTTATAGPPVTDLGLSVSLEGFSAGAASPVAARSCSR
ncbi:LPS-assembly protein LptD [Pseudoroseicyclus tamaricis]|uniref:LPS-assembly protein LptD n=1 Tax=Pseudoroseicyclus tamaricis TaxID=2705421 RepID=UPI001F436198|nr:LPS assembly protein LptD [Pseudoroseicyclus tamaricis]